ncbi:hypothetical protein H0H87_007708 [Tephrocybe sp. NHM501043]|nr:hypothetical protein H0H87_007708 [Tephrocybe sp. NHM501043]
MHLSTSSIDSARKPSSNHTSHSHSTSRNLPAPSSSTATTLTGTSKTKSTDSSSNLTPAAAVVAAYKRQTLLQGRPDNKRTTGGSSSVDTSASMSGFSRLSFGGDASEGVGFAAIERIASEAQGAGRLEGEEKDPSHQIPGALSDLSDGEGDDATHQPYYTIFGSTSGRVVAVGGPDDNRHLSWEISAPTGLVRKGSGLRSLTRKVSGRFKRGAQSEGEETETEKERVGERKTTSVSVERGRPSLQHERPSTSGTGMSSKRSTMSALGKGGKGGRSLRLSIDKFPEEAKALRSEVKETPPTSASKSPASAASTPSPSGGGGGGSRIWKLMKRISSGALREKYTYEEAPPVPSLPKEYMSPAMRPVPVDDEKDRPRTPPSAGGFGKAVRKKASLVLGTRASSANSSPTKAKLPRSPLTTQGPTVRPSPPAPRPSTTTRSSSPISSDVASARFFSGPGYKHSSTSAHSSASSLLFEDKPPLPQTHVSKTGTLGNHIIPPSELGKININLHPDKGYGGSLDSFALPSSRNLTHTSPTPTPSRSQMMKLKVVVPPTSSPSSPVQASAKSEEYVIVHTPAAEPTSLPPPRRSGRPGRGVRRNTNTPTAAENGWNDRQQEVIQGKELLVLDENMQEWERMWGSSGNLGERDGDVNEVSSRSGSPIIPSFSTADPINAFVSKRASTDTRRSKPSPSTSATSPSLNRHPLQLDEMGYSPAESLPPPPRPMRSAYRLNRPASISTPTSPVNGPMSPCTPGPSTSTTVSPLLSGSANDNRHSVASTLTITNAHRRQRSSSFLSSTSPPSPHSAPSSTSPPQRAIMFRELGRSNPGLTEQEKSARWEDLLERSAQAGGTLHLNVGGRSGEDGLKSDRLRFSDISELTIM